jgi:hypothetical protein
VKVFWSWQSDTPGKVGRHFIREALSKAISDLKIEIELDEPTGRDPRSDLHLDQDRQGVPGSPDLARVILEKISKASVFVADVTAVGTTGLDRVDGSEKKLINANVAIELGYALGTAGDSALLMVMNEYFGSREDLPFDLKAKAGPLVFSLTPNATKEQITTASHQLTAQLKEAIALCLKGKVEEIRKAAPFPAAEEKDGPARFRSPGNAIGIRSDSLSFGRGSEAPVFLLLDRPTIWLRLMPSSGVDKRWASHELRGKALTGSFDLKPFSEGSTVFGIRAEDGFGVCAPYPPVSDTATSIVFAFETGEVWSVDTDQLSFGQHIPFLEDLFVQRLQSYTRFLGSLGIEPPYRWICGMTGVKGYRLQVPTPSGYTRPGPGPQCLSKTIKAEGVFDGKESAQSALLTFFKEVFDRCGIPRPSHLPK